MMSKPELVGSQERAARAEKARQMRDAAEKAREENNQQQLLQLQKKWEEAAKAVDVKRDHAFALAKGRVSGWAARRNDVVDRAVKIDERVAERVSLNYRQKVDRVVAWRKRQEAEAEKRAADLAASRSAATSRFEQEQKAEATRLIAAMAKAEERRLLKMAEKRRLHQLRAEEAELKDDEMWAARVRNKEEWEKWRRQIEDICKVKSKRAEDVHQQRLVRVKSWRAKEAVWRNPISNVKND